MTLGPFGRVAIAQVVFYIPIAVVTFIVTLRHGFSRRLGWLFLFTFAMFRLVGGILTVVSHAESNPSSGIVVVASILTGIGLTPLLLATHAFVSGIAASIDHPLDRPLALSRVPLIVGLILGIIGGSDESSGNSVSTMNSGRTLVKAAIILFLAVYVFLALFHLLLWREAQRIPANFRKLLAGISVALVPLCVRIIYGLLSDFGPTNKFSPIFGEWQFFVFMGLLMEYIVVVIYIVTGLSIPVRKDVDSGYPMA